MGGKGMEEGIGEGSGEGTEPHNSSSCNYTYRTCSNVCADSAIAARTLQATTATAAACTCKRYRNMQHARENARTLQNIRSIWVHWNSKLKFQIELILNCILNWIRNVLIIKIDKSIQSFLILCYRLHPVIENGHPRYLGHPLLNIESSVKLEIARSSPTLQIGGNRLDHYRTITFGSNFVKHYKMSSGISLLPILFQLQSQYRPTVTVPATLTTTTATTSTSSSTEISSTTPSVVFSTALAPVISSVSTSSTVLVSAMSTAEMGTRVLGLGLESDSSPDLAGLGLGLESFTSGLGLGLGLEPCGIGLDSDSDRGDSTGLGKLHR